jgi:glycosyltransferase involved in cell wall biosynthesis
MRVLLVAHQYFPDHSAGTEVLTRSVARELTTQGHEVRVLTGYPTGSVLGDGERTDRYEHEGLPVYRFHHAYTPMGGQLSMIEVGYDNRLAAAFFARILAEMRPDVVHFFHLNRLGTGLIEEAVRQGVPCFMTPTDFWAICTTAQLVYPDGSLCGGPSAEAGNCVKHFAQNSSRNQLVQRMAKALPLRAADLLVRWTRGGKLPSYPLHLEVEALGNRLPRNVHRLNLLNRIVAPNDFMRQTLIRHGVEAGRIVQSAFGIELSPLPGSVRAYDGLRPLQIGFIGTLAPHKGAHVLVEAFRSLAGQAAMLNIYGKPDEFPEYVAKLQALAQGDERIRFRGVFPNGEISDVMAGLDVLVVPSLWYENTPLVIYSGQAARCVVVASDHPGISEVVQDRHSGLLFPAGNAAALADALRRLMETPGLLARLSANTAAPKSIRAYVTELLGWWRAAAPT